jgi:flagellar assembly protein FliH
VNALPLAALLPDFDTDPAASIDDRLHTRTAEADSRAQAELDAALAAARAEGYAAGKADGLAEGGARAAAALEAVTAALAAAQESTRAAVRQSLALDAATTIQAALELARWVLRRELAHDPACWSAALTEVVTGLAEGSQVQVAVHPDALAAYTSWAQGVATHQVQVVTEPGLEAGEVLVRTADEGMCRVSVAAALTRAAQNLGVSAGDPEQGA